MVLWSRAVPIGKEEVPPGTPPGPPPGPPKPDGGVPCACPVDRVSDAGSLRAPAPTQGTETGIQVDVAGMETPAVVSAAVYAAEVTVVAVHGKPAADASDVSSGLV